MQSQTSIPVPKILDWSDNAENPVGSEYIIMEHAEGVPLHQIWHTMDVTTQIGCIEAIQKNLKQVVDLEFPAYGSIYFADKTNIATSGPSLGHGFSIGPHCGAMYWNCNAAQPRYYHQVKPNQGPCML